MKHYILLSTPIGQMIATSTDAGISQLEFFEGDDVQSNIENFENKQQVEIVHGENAHLMRLRQELAEYFDGKRKEFDIALDISGTVFQQSVWESLLKIPYGKTTSYLQQAAKLHNPKGVRAVASANGKNKIAIIIPCHRVVGGNGNLTGYSGGLARKKWLLDHEAKYAGKSIQQELKF